MLLTSTNLVRTIAVATLLVASSISLAKEGSVATAPDMPDPIFVETNGIRMGVYVQGEGVPVVLCHGFPELAYSWRKQVGPFSKAGFRVIVPDQRGYGLTDQPEDVKSYDMRHLCDDLAGMLDALKIDKAVFCGHDWGGGVVWAMARLYPDRCLGIIGVNTPCSRPPGLPPVTPSEESLIKMTSEYYVAQFQKPGRAEAVLEKDVRKTFKHLLTKGDIWNVQHLSFASRGLARTNTELADDGAA